MDRNRWEDFKRDVKALSLPGEERKRVNQELSLFERRGWEEYILLLSDVLKAVDDNHPGCGEGGSALSSLALSLYSRGGRNAEDILSDEKGRASLFGGNLTMEWNIWWPKNRYTQQTVDSLESLALPVIGASGLHTVQKYVEYSPVKGKEQLEKENVEYLIVSTSSVPYSDYILITDDGVKRSEEDDERLKNYLVFRFTVDWFRSSSRRTA